ncbi:hypothetical protein FA15DRAFT_760515 [Coprinopsis marcescibilis]|uniref:F-box domain-containing protein n=1 Tax=Coprinopsis marcescibilis TaxID=230819 RepID=A0A5C3KF39_COPMA|nr:hypothetical protein FA15DRAFT_760515 [Coprinopsis marcescibilis]
MFLPDDVWIDIIGLLNDYNTLKQICTTNRLFSHHCQRHLFKDVVLAVALGKPELWTRMIQLQKALAHNPRLSGFVKSLCFRISQESCNALYWEDEAESRNINQEFQDAICPLLSQLESLDTLFIDNAATADFLTIPLHSERFFRSITSHLSVLRLRSVAFDIPLSFLCGLPRFEELWVVMASVRIVRDRPANLRPVRPKILAFVHRNLRVIQNQVDIQPHLEDVLGPPTDDTLALDKLQHFAFSDNSNLNHQRAQDVLKASSNTLRKISYHIPSYSAGGFHTERIDSPLIGQSNRQVFASLLSLREFDFYVWGLDCADDLLQIRYKLPNEAHHSVTGWIVNSCKVLDACPNLTTLRINITYLYNHHIFLQLISEWSTLNSHLKGGLLPSLKRLTFYLDLSEEWTKTDPNWKDLLKFDDFVNDVFAGALERGIEVVVGYGFDKQYSMSL